LFREQAKESVAAIDHDGPEMLTHLAAERRASRRTRMERVSNLLIEHCERNVRESDKNSEVLRAAA
jgi:hypothetical protein